MTLKITRVRPGVYRTEVNGREVYLSGGGGSDWQAVHPENTMTVLASGRTKKELVSRLEILARQTKDREKSDSHKIARRSRLTKGTELTLERGALRGCYGRVRFIGYTKTQDGAEWLDVVDRNGRSRAVDPAKVKTVHRDKKMW